MRFIDVGGAGVAVHVAEPQSRVSEIDVVLLHGAGMDHTVWRYQTRRLAGLGFRTFAPDLPGHGHSDGPALGSIPEMAEWLAGFLDGSGSNRAVVVGHSMGSFVALECAAVDPERIAGVVLIASSDSMDVHPELQRSADMSDPHAIELMVGWMHTGEQRLGGHRNSGSWSAGLSRATLAANLGVLGTDLAACADFDPMMRRSRVRQPTLIIQGTADRMTTVRSATRLRTGFEHAELTLIEGAGHMLNSEHAREVNEAVRRFAMGVTERVL